MRSNLGRFHRPMSRGLVNNMLTMNNLGDGSTLNLDFTTGVLDPRLTFSRASTATFVNSSGYVEWAVANLLRNSGWLDSNPTPTNWTLSGNAATIPATGFRTFTTTTAATSFITDSGISLSQGITYSAVIEVSAVSGSPTMINTMVATASPTNQQWYQDGTLVTSGTVITSGTITYVFTAGSGSFVRCGLGTTGSTVTSQSVTLTKPRVVPGVNINATYYESTTSAAYHAPRFDYSPTNIGEPRGLLVEGQTINVCPQSQALTTGWLNANMITPTNPAIADPFGGTSATWKLVAASGNAIHSWRHNVITLTAAAYTFSFWAKAAEYDRVVFADPGTGIGACTFVLTGNGTATVVGGATNPQITPYPNGWYRCSVTMTTSATTYAFGIAGYPAAGTTLSNFGATYTGTGTDGVYATGLQIELGSGASSYIPTGASQVTRTGDSCLMTGTNFSSWFAGATEGVLFAQYEKPRSQSGNAAHDFSAIGSRYTTGAGFILYAGNSNYYPTTILWPTGGAIFGGGIATAIPSVTKQAGKWFGGNDVTNYSNGVIGTTVAGTGTLTPAMLSFGANSATGTEATRDWLNSCIRQVKFYPTALSDAAIQTLTTP